MSMLKILINYFLSLLSCRDLYIALQNKYILQNNFIEKFPAIPWKHMCDKAYESLKRCREKGNTEDHTDEDGKVNFKIFTFYILKLYLVLVFYLLTFSQMLSNSCFFFLNLVRQVKHV